MPNNRSFSFGSQYIIQYLPTELFGDLQILDFYLFVFGTISLSIKE